MEDAAPADLMSVGTHCCVASCGQLDFLPFKCDCCERIYCLEHRTYTAHACPKARSNATEIIVCPLCARAVKLAPGQDANAAFESHVQKECDPANYAKVHKKPRCPVAGCKEKLSTINTYRCKHCGQRICLKHRHPDDHRCQEHRAATSGARVAAVHGPGAGVAGRAGTAAPPAAAAPAPAPPRPAPPRPDPQAVRARAAAQYAEPDNSVRGTAARRAPPPSSSSSARPAAAAASNANPLVSPHRPEQCPQCGAAFETVERLIQHVEDYHPSGGPSASGRPAGGTGNTVRNPLQSLVGSSTIAGGAAPTASAGVSSSAAGSTMPLFGGAAQRQQQQQAQQQQQEMYRCHFCSQSFRDPVALVQHSERCAAAAAAQGGKSSCVLS